MSVPSNHLPPSLPCWIVCSLFPRQITLLHHRYATNRRHCLGTSTAQCRQAQDSTSVRGTLTVPIENSCCCCCTKCCTKWHNVCVVKEIRCSAAAVHYHWLPSASQPVSNDCDCQADVKTQRMNSNNENERPAASLWQLSVIQAGWLAGWLAGRQAGRQSSKCTQRIITPCCAI